MTWKDEMIPLLRVLINDNCEDMVYSDSRLKELLVTAARFTVMENDFTNTYAISIRTLSISPDPTTINDDDFINLTVLKAACLVDQASFRTKACAAGIKAALGPVRIETDKYLDGFVKLLEKGPCKAYEDLNADFAYGVPPIRAILGPFVGNQFDPQIINNYYIRPESYNTFGNRHPFYE